ncbi:DNA-binding transcriptional MerR regulator [Neolewinella xylanilytica]|uniref:DNA-binding transcriptional MerR regulator n=1 Tax=Neolewinella xylanilytica TaxID=1514080 RepID=A0A2S6I261_9BACT|nr:MerR family transcriptional regulator [Neolewinella xylanilytica]PPK85169.1 DNA-binding transcriptional MerR regulator [Neolewinella xylanilytica]
MAVYSITDVEKLTGIRAHTLRAWEQRYDLIVARRSEHNVRYYLEEDLRELYNVAVLNRNGHRISRIAAMSPEERAAQVAALSSLNISPDTQLDALSHSTLEMNAEKFGLILDTNIDQRGFEETMMEVVYPFLDKLGVLYFTGSVTAVHESFVGCQIRQKLLAATDRLPPGTSDSLPSFTLFLPEDERQELSMLFIQYLLRRRGVPVLYLGGNLSPADLGDACKTHPTDYLFTILSSTYVARPVESLIREVLRYCPDSRFVLSGYQATLHDLSDMDRVIAVGGLREVLAFVDALSKPVDRNIAAAK